MKITPIGRELDGMRLDMFTAGSVREVSATTAAWLIAEGYAEPEMRSDEPEEDAAYGGRSDKPAIDRRQRNR